MGTSGDDSVMARELLKIVDDVAGGAVPDVPALAALFVSGAGDPVVREHAARLAREAAERRFGDGVFIRGLVEISSFCGNDCFYCGIRKSNAAAERYRLTDDEILEQCRIGDGLGFRTFVLQGGEDPALTDDVVVPLVARIRREFPGSAVTLSLGERSAESYRRLFEAGASRYLLRHESATAGHYARLHPPTLRLETRLQCLRELKAIGWQVGAGFMVGSPFQTAEDLARDLLFLREFRPAMVGIGPFIPHRDTPFAGYPAGALGGTLLAISLTRLLLPGVLLPATTALASVHPEGRLKGILAGANVVMPNLSPAAARGKYSLYNGKLASRAEAAENLEELGAILATVGRRIDWGRGDAVLE